MGNKSKGLRSSPETSPESGKSTGLNPNKGEASPKLGVSSIISQKSGSIGLSYLYIAGSASKGGRQPKSTLLSHLGTFFFFFSSQYRPIE